MDPGLTRCGIAVVDVDARRRAALVHVEVTGTPPTAPLDQRLLRIDEAVSAVLAAHRPDRAAVERMFANTNTPTVLGTAQAAGVAIAAAARAGVPVGLHTPSEVKAAVTGSGRADKKQMTLMITRILGLQKPPSPADAADALALAVCHSWRAPMQGRVAALDAQVSRSRAGFQAKVVKGRAAAATEAADAGRARGGTGSADQERARAAARAMARTKGVRW